ncbi:hypothetical protein V9K67_13470 [Paraflavisolibacter sp. H34]|uniref:hypothetical protein n=1 Tax=Huijunlia imazamoxiresistens TaxID=3127457 RepID=UPI0030191598
MRKNFIACIILPLHFLLSHRLYGQGKLPPADVQRHTIGFSPFNNHTHISGVAIGLTAHPWSAWNDTTYVQVNGLNIEVGPLGIVGGIWGTLFGLIGRRDSLHNRMSIFTHNAYSDSTDFRHVVYGTKINGVSVSIGGISETFNSGIIVNGLSGYVYTTSGIQVSGLLNEMFAFKGLLVAGISNKTNIGKGVQIALINNSNTGQVFQIGLFNRIGKRVLPFINFGFKKEHKASPGK